MTTEKNQTWWPVVGIAGELVAWMAILAAGAYWAPVGGGEEDAAPAGDFRKLWVVAGTTGLFLLLWGGVLWRFAVKSRRRGEDSADSEDSPAR